MQDGYLMKQARAFTAIELVTVLSIVGVLAAATIPSVVSQMPRYRLHGAARQIMGDLMRARMQAVSQKNEFKVFLPNNHEYRILDDDDNDGTADTGEQSETKDIQALYRDVTLSWTAGPTFFPRGSASPATITVTNSSGSKDIKIHITGRVKIENRD
jgi:type IV fimbrial biogenesis protein FimT